jgi:glycosyltransferase involved in cell wall biosynthesis
LDSILNQTYKDLEIIVVDDGSTDSTPDIVEEYQRRYGEKIKLKRLERNRGPSFARNEGIKLAEGEYIAFCDSDDWFHPERIEKMVKVLADNSNIVFVSTNGYYFDEEKGEIDGLRVENPPLDEISRNAFLISLEYLKKWVLFWPFMVRKFVLKEELFDPGIRKGEDTDLMIRIAYRYPQGFIFLNEPLYYKRNHPERATTHTSYLEQIPFYRKFVSLWRRDLALPQEIRARYLALRTKFIRWFANALLKEGHYKEAFQFYKEIIKDEPFPLRLAYKLFMLFPSLGKFGIKFWHFLRGVK